MDDSMQAVQSFVAEKVQRNRMNDGKRSQVNSRENLATKNPYKAEVPRAKSLSCSVQEAVCPRAPRPLLLLPRPIFDKVHSCSHSEVRKYHRNINMIELGNCSNNGRSNLQLIFFNYVLTKSRIFLLFPTIRLEMVKRRTASTLNSHSYIFRRNFYLRPNFE